MRHFDVRDVGFEEFEFEAAEHHTESEVELGPRQTVACQQMQKWLGMVVPRLNPGFTYVIPKQDLVPRPNETMNRSRGMPSLVFGSFNQRSGMNSRDWGNRSSSCDTSGMPAPQSQLGHNSGAVYNSLRSKSWCLGTVGVSL